MTAAAANPGRAVRPLLWLAMPVLAVVNQYLAMRAAQALAGRPFGTGWLAAAIRTPWVQTWIGCEIVTFAVWMVVLSSLSLASAFPMTALGYVLVVAMGWISFGEPVTWQELAGGAAILGGVLLLGEGEAKA